MEDSSTRYPSDLSDLQWEAVSRLLPTRRPVGAERVTSMRAVVNAALYRQRAGCSWRMLPHDFPHWRTVYGYFRRWHADRTWEKIQAAVRQETRAASIAQPHSHAARPGPCGAVECSAWTKSAC